MVQPNYEINQFGKEESWRMFRYIGEIVEGLDRLSGVEPAVSIYGSARVKPEDELYAKTEEIAHRLGELGFSIITGGGPGIMEAANKGAFEAGTNSIGLNVELPYSQTGNAYRTIALTFNHFFVRKLMLVKYATAFVIMPGGLGTLDELTEVLTLIQTQKIRPFPVVLFGSSYWSGFLDWLKSTVLAKGMVSVADFSYFLVVDDVKDVVEAVQRWYIKHEISGKRAVAEPEPPSGQAYPA